MYRALAAPRVETPKRGEFTNGHTVAGFIEAPKTPPDGADRSDLETVLEVLIG